MLLMLAMVLRRPYQCKWKAGAADARDARICLVLTSCEKVCMLQLSLRVLICILLV